MNGRSQSPSPSETARESFLRRLSERYRQPLTAYFQRRVHSRIEAEDLTQEVFLHLVRRMDVEAIENPEAFVFRSAVNLLRDRSRRGKTLRSHLAELTHHHAEVEELSPERVFDSQQSLTLVLSVLEELDERSRDAFILHRLEGMKHAEIAEFMGVSISSVEKYIIKALSLLTRRSVAAP